MSGDLARMQQDDTQIASAIQGVNCSGLSAYETTVARATAAVSARQSVLTPLAGIVIDEESPDVDHDELLQHLRAFYIDEGQEGIERLHHEHAEARAGLERAIDAEDLERERQVTRERVQRHRAAKRLAQSAMVGANG